MGTEIKYKVENLNKNIARLRELKTELSVIDVTVEESDAAKGANSDTIREINDTYPMMKEALSRLLDSSIGYFSKVSSDLALADRKAKLQVQQLRKLGQMGGAGK